MLLSALILPALASAVEVPALPTAPITVTGRAWAPFISPMGEPFRARTTADDTLAKWFRQADQNHDGVLTPDEMQADADRFFATLDINHDGEIDPEELVHYEWEVAPEIQAMSKRRRAPGETGASSHGASSARRQAEDSDDDGLGGKPGRGRRRGKDDGLQGAARYALLNIPEPVAAADADFDRGISLSEFRSAAAERFVLLDSARQGRLTLVQLQAVRQATAAAGERRKHGEEAVDRRVGNPLPPGD